MTTTSPDLTEMGLPVLPSKNQKKPLNTIQPRNGNLSGGDFVNTEWQWLGLLYC